MQIFEESKKSSKVLKQFTSVVGIRCSDRNLIAIGQLQSDNKDYLIHYFRVKPAAFEITHAHLSRLGQISHPNVQKVVGVLADQEFSEVCIIYKNAFTLIEQLDSKKYFSSANLVIFLSNIQAGVKAQKEVSGSENNFVNEWNIFQCGDQFSIGVSLPMPSAKLLVPFDGILGKISCQLYNPISIVPPEMLSEMEIESQPCDAFSLGILGLRLIGMDQILEEKFGQLEESIADTALFDKKIAEVLAECEKNGVGELINFFRQVLEDNRSATIEKIIIPKNASNKIVNAEAGLHSFHSFTNGPIPEPGPHNSHNSGHHGKKRLRDRLVDEKYELDTVYSIMLSGKDKLLVSGSADCSLKLFDFENSKLIHTFENAHTDSIISVAISYDGKLIASGSRNRTLNVYSAKDKKKIITKPHYHSGVINTLAFTKNNRFLVSGSNDGSIKIMDFNTVSEPVITVNNVHLDGISYLALIDEDRTIISSSFDKTVRFFDVKTGRSKKTVRNIDPIDFSRLKKLVECMAVNKRLFVTGSNIGTLFVYDLRTTRVLAVFKNEVKENAFDSRAVCITPDSKYIIYNLVEKIKIYHLTNRAPVFILDHVHTKLLRSILCTETGEHLVSCSLDTTIQVLNLKTLSIKTTFEIKPDLSVKSLVITPNNKFAVLGDADGNIIVFDLETQNIFHSFQKAHKDWITGLVVTMDGKTLVSASADKSISKWNLSTMEHMQSATNVHTNWIFCMSLSPNNEWLATGSLDRSVKTLSFESLDVLSPFINLHHDAIRSLAISADSELLVTGSYDCSIKVIHFASSQLMLVIPYAHRSSIWAVKITPDRRFIISGSKDGSMKVYDLHNHKFYWSQENAHDHWIKCLALTPDNKYVITGSSDHSIAIFDINSKVLKNKYHDIHNNWVSCLAISSNGSIVVSASYESVKIYRFI